ncbi:MAG: pyridoxamine 5'-phosphate oxidase family protein [Methanosarcina thermophila]|jgi:hypothetical protein|uniref:Pyridoxamine 5'-phosphate oxidase n=3 Tax=Methanosarcina thermophila TaxID=2210 RepID=A0A1I6ZU67_METTE|nr:pyridoxamine 5'-phosphate oxidase family protein [Methanosarcina thermophila]ALK06046.1 MAG: pyridoxamine 5-phosphate oxidase [Methanosarcina sp. 795]AKB12367.1 hypothetical protein MSTHT_0609 [Methanosarcina thermophila TM-1]AKB14429.1 hypothetical protein MSTHC_0111 [Methanosarcina thermophila CHTI-55]NLU57061.1 pyridoxamine 5'-phosphate oxidase family protein [Methanosarcina thermophila]SFT66211.1 Pyridoxamine 5'-phosphate oxidase [Methanosarcina thermophila]
MPANLIEYFNKAPRLGVLSTSSSDGRVDSAVFGSPQMIDEKTVLAATANNRTFANLLENPYATYTIIEPADSITDWKGIRVYMKLKEYTTSGELLEMIRTQAANFVGEEAAKLLHAALTFEVYEVRPLIDFGQGWEKSI